MKINVISDLHGIWESETNYKFLTKFSFKRLQPADVLVIAGDLGYTGKEFKNEVDYILNNASLKRKFKDVVIVKGNHDFYGESYRFKYNEILDKDNLDPFNDEWNYVKEIDNVVFICSPMFSPIVVHQEQVEYCLSDFRYIPQWTISKNNEIYDKNIDFLYSSYNRYKDSGKSIVMVTHHCPDERLIDDKYKQSFINEAFTVMDCNQDERMIELKESDKIKYWIHGHTHSSVNKKIGNITYVRNAIGYAFKDWKIFRNECKFSYNFIIEI